MTLRAVEFMVGRETAWPYFHQGTSLVNARPSESLRLEVGDWVRVKSEEEIRRTLDERAQNLGLWFVRERRCTAVASTGSTRELNASSTSGRSYDRAQE